MQPAVCPCSPTQKLHCCVDAGYGELCSRCTTRELGGSISVDVLGLVVSCVEPMDRVGERSEKVQLALCVLLLSPTQKLQLCVEIRCV